MYRCDFPRVKSTFLSPLLITCESVRTNLYCHTQHCSTSKSTFPRPWSKSSLPKGLYVFCDTKQTPESVQLLPSWLKCNPSQIDSKKYGGWISLPYNKKNIVLHLITFVAPQGSSTIDLFRLGALFPRCRQCNDTLENSVLLSNFQMVVRIRSLD